jgi:hypothetical protein
MDVNDCWDAVSGTRRNAADVSLTGDGSLRIRGGPCTAGGPVHLFQGRKRVLQAWPDRGVQVRKAKWMWECVAGSEAEGIQAEHAVGKAVKAGERKVRVSSCVGCDRNHDTSGNSARAPFRSRRSGAVRSRWATRIACRS